MKDFRNKVAAITGAGSGIGRALALNLAAQGCHLAISDIDPKGLEATAKQAKAHGVTVTSKTLDVADREAMHAWADEVVREHGQVNMIFNNAGVAQSGSVEGTSYEDYDWILDINFRGVLYGTKAFLPYLKKAPGGGHVINVSSVFGLFSQPGMSAYNATKFAVRGFTESLRQELDLRQLDAKEVDDQRLRGNRVIDDPLGKLERGVEKREGDQRHEEKDELIAL